MISKVATSENSSSHFKDKRKSSEVRQGEFEIVSDGPNQNLSDSPDRMQPVDSKDVFP